MCVHFVCLIWLFKMFKNPNNCGLSLLKKNDSKTKYIHDKNPPHKAEFLLN